MYAKIEWFECGRCAERIHLFAPDGKEALSAARSDRRYGIGLRQCTWVKLEERHAKGLRDIFSTLVPVEAPDQQEFDAKQSGAVAQESESVALGEEINE